MIVKIDKSQILDPNTNELLPVFISRQQTIELLAAYRFEDDTGKPIDWTPGQIEIIDCILHRSAPDGKKRIEIIASTQYGKSLAVAAGVTIRASLKPEKWAIVAGTSEKAKIIMEYVIMLSLNNEILRAQLTADTPLDQLRMKRSATRITYKRKGEVRTYSAESKVVSQTSKALMGFGSPNVIEDEAGLIGDILQATVMRMLGGTKDNFLIKIGNPFTRNHFFRTWLNGQYYRIFIDYKRAIAEGRYAEDYIAEMKEEALFDILYACLFPKEGLVDSKGWLPLLTTDELERALVTAWQPFGRFRLGNDVAGGGRNYSVIVLRGYNVAIKMYKENEPDTMKFLNAIQKTQIEMGVRRDDIYIDKNGIGKGMYDRAVQMNDKVNGISGAQEPADKIRFVNLRAEMYWRLREWILKGGKLERDNDWYQLLKIKYQVVERSGKIIIQSKQEMLQEGIDSPDVADAFSLTFAKLDDIIEEEGLSHAQAHVPNDDPYA